MQPIKLSNEDTVVMKPHITHEADMAYYDALLQGVKKEVNPATGKMVVTEMPPRNADRAIEAALPFLIESITGKDGVTKTPTASYLNGLWKADYQKLQTAFNQLDKESEEKTEEGKKKG